MWVDVSIKNTTNDIILPLTASKILIAIPIKYVSYKDGSTANYSFAISYPGTGTNVVRVITNVENILGIKMLVFATL